MSHASSRDMKAVAHRQQFITKAVDDDVAAATEYRIFPIYP